LLVTWLTCKCLSATRHELCVARRCPVGAEVHQDHVHFRVWAPKRKRVQVLLEGSGEKIELRPEHSGYFAAASSSARDGDRYRLLLDQDEQPYPDPASRFQPEGPHGPSQIVDPDRFQWSDGAWTGVDARRQVIYEMHIGAFTTEGTWESAKTQLPELRNSGITLLEIMPIADFPGRWGWGYDGVNLFAPTRLYGSPEDARRFVDEAHRLGMGVILDVVYNHLGPDGNYVSQFSDEYFTTEFKNDWGEAINFASEPVREFYAANAAYWIREFHFDGLRFDATQDIHDRSPEHILGVLTRAAREAAGGKGVYLVAENEPQHARLVRDPARGGYGFTALWNDDLHHSTTVALTGRKEAYYTDYSGAPQEFVSAAKYGYLYQGQWYSWQKKERGLPALDLQPWNFVTYLQNHDQIANSASGLRPNVVSNAGRYRALTALLLLGPGTPMLFQGQEFGATTPFLYFCDHSAALCQKVAEGRKEFLAQFPSIATPEAQAHLSDPGEPSTFERSKLDPGERTRNAPLYKLHRDLLRLRSQDPVIRNLKRGSFDGAVLGSAAFLLRYFGEDAGDRLLIVNLGADLAVDKPPEPLIAPPERQRWELLWSSEDPEYSGSGTVRPAARDAWIVAGNSAVFLASVPDFQTQEE
jgi:maltooligosyltrehalose trehalohydrolase